MAVGEYLISQGAQHLVLIGRSGASTDDAKSRIAHWRHRGVEVHEALVDVTDFNAVERLFAGLSKHAKVKGIVHAAGVLDDTRIAEMTKEQVTKVMRPKVHGAWNLHKCSLQFQLSLDHFVLFSSVAAIVGNGRQANYVAANALLDALAAYRRSIGLPATSIQWGALAEVGMAADEELQRQFRLMGITPFTAEEAMAGLEVVLRYQPTQLGIVDVDLVQWGKFEPAGGKSPRFAHLTGRHGNNSNDSIASSLRQLAENERFEIAELMLAEQVAQTLRIPVERMDLKRSLTDMGIDSLMAVELQIAIEVTFGVEFSALELTRGLNITQLTTPLLERMGLTATASGDSQNPVRESEMDRANGSGLPAAIIQPATSSQIMGQHA